MDPRGGEAKSGPPSASTAMPTSTSAPSAPIAPATRASPSAPPSMASNRWQLLRQAHSKKELPGGQYHLNRSQRKSIRIGQTRRRNSLIELQQQGGPPSTAGNKVHPTSAGNGAGVGGAPATFTLHGVPTTQDDTGKPTAAALAVRRASHVIANEDDEEEEEVKTGSFPGAKRDKRKSAVSLAGSTLQKFTRAVKSTRSTFVRLKGRRAVSAAQKVEVQGTQGSFLRRGRPTSSSHSTPWLAHESRPRMVWNIILMFLVVYNSIVIPLEMANVLEGYKVDDSLNCDGPSTISHVHFVIDLIFMLDLFMCVAYVAARFPNCAQGVCVRCVTSSFRFLLIPPPPNPPPSFSSNFFTPYMPTHEMNNKKAPWVTQPRKTVVRYVYSWFIIDLMASFPFDLMVDGHLGGAGGCDAGGSTRATSLLRVGKAAKITRIIRILRVFRIMRIFRISVS